MNLKLILKNEFRQEKGFILMTTYLMVSVLATMSFALFSQEVAQIRAADRNSKRMLAFNMAESGFDDAFYKLKNNVITTFPYTGSYTSMNAGSVRGGLSSHGHGHGKQHSQDQCDGVFTRSSFID